MRANAARVGWRGDAFLPFRQVDAEVVLLKAQVSRANVASLDSQLEKLKAADVVARQQTQRCGRHRHPS